MIDFVQNVHNSNSFSTLQYFETGGLGACGNKDFPNIYVRLEDKEILNWVKVVAGIETPGISMIDFPSALRTEAISSKFEL